MLEVTTEAIVLDKEDLGEQDSRVFLYTKDFGKISAKATSLRKITSKLAAHLEPFNYISARLISKGDFFDGKGFQLADALLIDSAKELKSDINFLRQALEVFNLFKKSIPDGVPDLDLWKALEDLRLKKISLDLLSGLKMLGFDAEFSSCELCNKTKPEFFYPKDNFFLCRPCKFSLAGQASTADKLDFIKISV